MREDVRAAESLIQAGAQAPHRLKRRADFLFVAGGQKAHSALFTVQARARAETAEGPRVGLTVTKKVGTAVERNRIKRRLREALRSAAALQLAPSHDYVVVARRPLLSAPFAAIGAGLRMTVAKANSGPRAGGGRAKDRGGRPSQP